ncbi:hypothetical protein BBF96_05395 [Anoxybacter fermentans]|uniref:FdhC protein n=1 Tax=Anoxybacter fermentans TaxID=1323375 RepID=A0A3S9SX97_9FIRM|nr:formate/nitrite transporter family protein [Anoxybacter fermentans]AZR72872.1 hypothetical protein BBF96_05395 [Anoxybacter fermentans]
MAFYSPKEVAKLTVEGGVKKANQGTTELLISSFLAGAFIAMAAEASTMVGHDVAKYLGYGITKFLIGSVFSLGLLLVVICGASLFTGNNLIIMAYLSGRTTLKKMFRNWGWVFLGNFIGSIFVAYVMYKTNLWQANHYLVGASALKIANAKVNLTITEAFFRGIMCNWLVCLAVWAMTSARDIIGKVAVCYFIIMAFVASGFEHVIANMYYIPIGLFLKDHFQVVQAAGLENALSSLTWTSMVVKNFIPVLLGNIVGGAFFVGTLYWAIYLRESPVQVEETGLDINS